MFKPPFGKLAQSLSILALVNAGFFLVEMGPTPAYAKKVKCEGCDLFCSPAPGPFPANLVGRAGCIRGPLGCKAVAPPAGMKKCSGTDVGFYGVGNCVIQVTGSNCAETEPQGVVGVYEYKCGRGCICTVGQQRVPVLGWPVTKQVKVDDCD